MALIYIVEDDINIREIERYALKNSGFEVEEFDNGKDFFQRVSEQAPSLMLLDIMLPGEDGLEILGRVRKNPATEKTPVIMVTAKTTEIDKVRGLDMGADDYIAKPFGTSELLARIRTALRHVAKGGTGNTVGDVFTLRGLTINFDKRQIIVDGKDVHLTQIEFKIVSLLAKSAGRVLTYDYIITELWGPYAIKDNQILRVNMANIRRKLEKNPAQPQYIFTEVGVGYRMAEE